MATDFERQIQIVGDSFKFFKVTVKKTPLSDQTDDPALST